MTAKDLRKAIMYYLNRNPTGDEVELHSVHHRAHIEKWNCPEKQPSEAELETLLDEVKDVAYAEMKERMLPETERKEAEFRKKYTPEKIRELQDQAIQALAEGKAMPKEYQEYINDRERVQNTKEPVE
jgi:hypothetical protein